LTTSTPTPTPSTITRLLRAWSAGDAAAGDALMPLVYDELRRRARRYLRRERREHTLEPTALVHEAYMRLVDQREADWRNRTQFYAVAAVVMRRVLVDHARSHRAEKRGGSLFRVPLDEGMAQGEAREVDLMDLEEALVELAAHDTRQARIVELRYFAGLSIEETAEVVGISPATAKRDWTMARAWLYRRVSPGASPES
jgi:RNA polymerase sigma factor (TIGR02999 family)